ncbi:actin cortical patch SUR7/pH-response regulator pali [Hygrophoropsis aurantiaca]|uniref:Actin cortical patch SUR7/pH-response regulator pali n=1 Tax=Hygrophoropsis aurantiaca TaxID=72124 RepID=A0ACB8AF62_9AGAM|nr:actin cortical patch SUR7/pH-response regulator pali [Hygrophoropsis aurantiaca]
MPRSFCIPGIIFLFCAFVLLFIVSISVPYLTAMDITRVHFENSPIATLSQLRLGIWGYCDYSVSGSRTCYTPGHGYSIMVGGISGNGVTTATIGSSWTRGLAVHPVALVVTFIALLLSFSQHVTVTLAASLVSFLAAVLTLIAFAIDIALYAYTKDQMNKLNVGASTITGPAFWLTFVSMILLFLAGCTVCFGRRRDRMSGATSSYPMSSTGGFLSRFRKN